jgi:integrase
LAVTCGLRLGEALCLRWENVDLDNKIIRIRENYTKKGNMDVFSTLKTECCQSVVKRVICLIMSKNKSL